MTGELVDRLRSEGFNRDIIITRKLWEQLMEDEHRSRLSLAAIEGKDEETYRDERSTISVELKDYRNLELPGEYVAELERFNPEKHPLLHVLFDFPNWFWKNRVKNSGPKRLEKT